MRQPGAERDPNVQTEESDNNDDKEDTIEDQLERLQAKSVHELIGLKTGGDHQSLSKLLYLTTNFSFKYCMRTRDI